MKSKILILLTLSIPSFGMSRTARTLASLVSTAIPGYMLKSDIDEKYAKTEESCKNSSDIPSICYPEEITAFVRKHSGISDVQLKTDSYDACFSLNESKYIKLQHKTLSPILTYIHVSKYRHRSLTEEDREELKKSIAIIQHEAGHIKANHMSKRKIRELIIPIAQTHSLVSALTFVLNFKHALAVKIYYYGLMPIVKIGLAYVSAKLITIVNPAFLLLQKQNRDEELEADRNISPEYLQARINDFEKRLETNFNYNYRYPEGRCAKLLKSHPSIQRRIELAQERLEKYKASQGSSQSVVS